MRLFRERLLERLLDTKAISRELVAKLLAWRHPGFSAPVGERIAAEDKRRLEDTTASTWSNFSTAVPNMPFMTCAVPAGAF